MLKVVLLSVLLVPSLSFARGPRMSSEAVAAVEACGLSFPEKGQRPSREDNEKIRTCLDNAGIEISRGQRPQKQRRGNQSTNNNSID